MYINMLTQLKIRELLFLKTSFAIIHRWVNTIWDAIANILTNLFKQRSHKIYVNNQHIINNVVETVHFRIITFLGNIPSGLKTDIGLQAAALCTCTRSLFIATTHFEYFHVFRGDIWDQCSTAFWSRCFITSKWEKSISITTYYEIHLWNTLRPIALSLACIARISCAGSVNEACS